MSWPLAIVISVFIITAGVCITIISVTAIRNHTSPFEKQNRKNTRDNNKKISSND